jgi:hypothetical protein
VRVHSKNGRVKTLFCAVLREDYTLDTFHAYTLKSSSHSFRKCRSVLTRSLCSGGLALDLLHFTPYPEA